MAGDPPPYHGYCQCWSGPALLSPNTSPRTVMVNMPLPTCGVTVARLYADGSVTIKVNVPGERE
jgi:hypothetical protein